jgi:hypothetical protein
MATHESSLSAFETPRETVSHPTGYSLATTADADQSRSLLPARRIWVFLVAMAIAIVFLGVVARAQEAAPANPPAPAVAKPQTLDPRLTDPTTVKKMTDAAARMLKNDPTANDKFARAYFSIYVPGILTDPQHAATIKNVITDLNKMISSAASSKNEAIQAKTNQFIFGSLGPIAKGNFSPQARVVAISILGRLDSKPLDQQTKTAPVPYQPALGIFWNLIKDDQAVEGVFAAALAAFHRHMTLSESVQPQVAQAVRKRMEDLLSAQPPQGRSPEVHAYIQRYAVDVLDHLTAQKDSQFGTKLISIATDEKSPDLIAFHSAGKLGNLSDVLKGKVDDPEMIMNSWSRRLLKTLESELARIKAYDRPPVDRDQPRDPKDFLTAKKPETKKPMPGGMMEGMEGSMDRSMMEGSMMEGSMMEGSMMEGSMMEGMMMEGMMMEGMMGVPQAKPQPAEIIAARQKINFALEYMNLGAAGSRMLGLPKTPRGIYAALPEEDRTPVDKWITLSQAVSSALNDKSLDDRKKFSDALTAQITYMRQELGIVDEPVDDEQGEDPVGGQLAGDAPAAAGAAAAQGRKDAPSELDSEF